jgi:hypothetical protein
MPPSITGARALLVGGRYQAQQTIGRRTLPRLWDKITRSSRQQVAIHLPATGGQPARHIATGVPRADFRRLMRVENTPHQQVSSAAAPGDRVQTARRLAASATIPDQGLQDDEVILLAQQIGRGEFGFLFRAAPESLQNALAALETREPQLAALVLDRYQLDGDEADAARHAESLLAALRGASPEQAVAQARSALEAAFQATVTQRLEMVERSLDLQYGTDVHPPSTDRLLTRDRELASTLSHLLIDDSDRMMSPAGIDLTIQACTRLLPPAASTPSVASTLRTLATLRDSDNIRRLVGSIGDSGGEDPRVAPAAEGIVRASQGLSADTSIDRAALRRTALAALLTPLRQGQVGSCFATSVGHMLKTTHPEAFLRDIKRMLEEGELVRTDAGSPAARQAVPISLQTDTSRLERGFNDPNDPAQAGHLQKAVSLGRMTGAAGYMQTGRDIQAARTLLKQGMPAGPGKAAAAVEPSAGAVLRQVIATRHGAKGVVGDIDQVRSRMRDLITERSDLKERVIPDSTRQSTTTAAELDRARAEMNAARSAYKSVRDEHRPAGWLERQMYTTRRDAAERRYLKLEREFEALESAPRRLADAQKRLGEIDTLIEQASNDLVRFAEAEMSVADPDAYARDLKLAQSMFLAQVDDPLLRAWEYTMASQVEQDESISDNKKLEDIQTEQLRDFLQRQLDAQPLNGRPARVPESFVGSFVAAYREVLRERVRFAYDASTPTALAADGNSSAGAWVMYIKDPGSENGASRPILGKQDFKSVTGDLIREAGNRISARYRGRIDAEKVSEQLASGFYDSDGWVEAVTSGLGGLGDEARTQLPWRIDAGGAPSALLASALGVPHARLSEGTVFKDLESGNANTGEQLLDTVIANLAALRGALTPEQLADMDTLMFPVANKNHSFIFQPGHPDLQPLLKGSLNTEDFKIGLKQRATERLNAPLDEPTIQRTLEAVRPHFPIGVGKGKLSFETFERSIRQAAAGAAPMTPERFIKTYREAVMRSGLSAEVADVSSKLWIEPGVFASAIASAPGSHAGVADLNWKSGSDPDLMAIAYNPFRSRFESGTVRKDAQIWTTDSSWAEEGLYFIASHSMIQRPPAGIA